jgi:phage I-like protein
MRTDARRYFDALTTDGVERAEPDGPPTAFRIWKSGSNITDHGPTIFSERSASLLLAEQSTRGNRYSIDIDHMSLDKSAPLANHAAVGWFSLAVRNGELWATDIEWVNDEIRAGLTRGAWKYMSPAYDVDKQGVVTKFLNLSLTANPATHSTTALASRRATQKDPRKMAKANKAGMKWGDIKAALDGEDEDAKATALRRDQGCVP